MIENLEENACVLRSERVRLREGKRERVLVPCSLRPVDVGDQVRTIPPISRGTNTVADNPSQEAGLPLYGLEVVRVKPGQSLFIRTLSTRIAGCLTHWLRGRSHYCDPDGCRPELHRIPPIWKGYIAAEVWLDDRQHWLPCVVELSESLELDMRQKYERAQVWNLRRKMGRKDSTFPTVGVLQETLDPKSVPASFDVLPVLQSLFHYHLVRLDQANPLPARVALAASMGAPPAAIAAAQATTSSSATDVSTLKTSIADFMRKKKIGS